MDAVASGGLGLSGPRDGWGSNGRRCQRGFGFEWTKGWTGIKWTPLPAGVLGFEWTKGWMGILVLCKGLKFGLVHWPYQFVQSVWAAPMPPAFAPGRSPAPPLTWARTAHAYVVVSARTQRDALKENCCCAPVMTPESQSGSE